MLLIIMYHRIAEGKLANPLPLFKEHLSFLANKYPIVLPGEPLEKGRINICLTFDDAFCDFYPFVYPLLKKHKIRAILAPPYKYIQESTTLPLETRLTIPYNKMMDKNNPEEFVPYCTWEEIREMLDSGHIEIASHSISHPTLTNEGVNLQEEIVESKKLLEEKLPQKINTFIHPFGKTSPEIQKLIDEHYKYSMRIGGAMNFGWEGKQPLCRINGDMLKDPTSLLSIGNKCFYFAKALVNKLR